MKQQLHSKKNEKKNKEIRRKIYLSSKLGPLKLLIATLMIGVFLISTFTITVNADCNPGCLSDL